MADEQLAEADRRYEIRLSEARFHVDNAYQEWNKAKSALLALQRNRESIILSSINKLEETQDAAR